jgi:methionine synthase I (cobalamin-dependent)/5,10-methylenetetrahydrofolate reductase
MPEKPFLKRLADAPVVFDGAMGTLLYQKGVFINRCFDELCLSNQTLVREIHSEYVEAGADVIESNTFGATAVRLREFGLAERCEEINTRGVELAREAAGDDVYVAGSMGPCLRANQVFRESMQQELTDAFTQAITAQAKAGVDLFVLETFSDLHELLLAADIAHGTGIPVMASLVFPNGRETVHGVSAIDAFDRLNRAASISVVGMNCGTGPSQLYDAATEAVRHTDKPLIVMPNAGQPQEVEGRMLYLATPEYFTEYAKRLIELGVSGVGGCCGTTPAHISEAAKAIHPLHRATNRHVITVVKDEDTDTQPVAMAQKSRLAAKLALGESVTSIELLPPRSCVLDTMLEKARTCHLAGIDAINIPDGPRASARVSPMIASIAIQQQIGIEAVLHYCCRDRNLLGMQSDLMGANAAGVHNVLIITGDPPKIGDYPAMTGVFDVDAIGLTQMASNLNRGRDLGGTPVTPPSELLIGVGVNPCAVDPQREFDRYREKIEAGADFAITQPVFDPDTLLRFIERAATLPRQIPIIAGVWPLVSFKNAEFMNNEVPGVEIPDTVLTQMHACKTKDAGLRAGCQIARDVRDRIADAVAGFQVSAPFGRVELALDVLN